jgi:dihydroorotate dehydrogenase
MPDWFYRTVSRPLLFRLPAAAARDFTLGFLGRLARLPLGPAVIDFLGHMGPDPRLRRTALGAAFPSAVGLGPWLDARAAALPALARFGFGFLEVGPVTLEPAAAGPGVGRRPAEEALWYPDPPPGLPLARAGPRLAEAARLGLPLLVRLGLAAGAGPDRSGEEGSQLVRQLAPHADVFTLPAVRLAIAAGWSGEQSAACLRPILAAARGATPARPVLVCVPADADAGKVDPLVEAALGAGAAGLLVDGLVRAEPAGVLAGVPARAPALEQVRRLRRRWGAGVPVVAAGGVHEPEDALELLAAGADLVQADTGLLYTGPGLPKRINEALLYAGTRDEDRTAAPSPAAPPPGAEGTASGERAAEMSWLWTALLGAGMLLGSLLALAVAATRVVLPYDEAFAGMSRAELEAVNPRLLPFMTHDRVALAGTMVAIGVLYLGLSLGGVRRGLHWARQAVYYSAFTGFASFFLFLGFGYLDPFHAFVTVVLLQLLLLAVHCRLGRHTPAAAPDLRGGAAWRRGLWGQLLLVVHGAALLAAGAAICAVGVTRVFVPEDLAFMRTTAEALRAANPRLVPLVAHDRATFGGMLLASGWAFLLPALWGFRRGSAWLWWSLLAGGLSAYAAAIGVHYAVGYTDLHHLVPPFAGLALFALGLGLSYSYLAAGGQAGGDAWQRLLPGRRAGSGPRPGPPPG